MLVRGFECLEGFEYLRLENGLLDLLRVDMQGSGSRFVANIVPLQNVQTNISGQGIQQSMLSNIAALQASVSSLQATVAALTARVAALEGR
jgi:hypothetical protein